MKICKKYIVIIFAVLMIASIGFGFVMAFVDNDSILDYEDTDKYVIQNGEYSGDSSTLQFGIDESGTYNFDIEVNCKECPGFVTAVILKDMDGNICDWDTGAYFTVSGRQLELKEGLYTVDYIIIPTEEELIGFVSNLDPERTLSPFNDARDGEWEVQRIYRVEQNKSDGNMFFALGILGGLALAGLLVALMTEGNKQIYDERQKINQGKAFKYAFFTILIYFILFWIVKIIEISLPISDGNVVFTGIIMAVAVFVEYSVFHDCYFALNTKKTLLIVLLCSSVVIQIPFCIINLINRSKFACMFTSTLIFVTVVLVSVIIKLLTDKRKNSLEDGEED